MSQSLLLVMIRQFLYRLSLISTQDRHDDGFLISPDQQQSPRPTARPKFDDLPIGDYPPKASAWGLWGEDDERGTLNMIAPSVTRSARDEVKQGLAVSLNLPLNVPLRPMNPRRKACVHQIISKGHANDDELDINTQSSTHWDGLRHYPYSTTGQFYNGVTQQDITGGNASDKLGIQNMATHPIVTRGVLLDWYSYAQRHGIRVEAFTNQEIPLSQLQQVALEQKVFFRPGDVLIIRTGWLAEYKKLTTEQQDRLGGRDDRSSCGVEASKECIEWHWEQGFAAVASDTVAYEAWPSNKPWGVSMHEVLLSGWGMPIGECFDLEVLASTCRRLQRWTFMFTSQPLHIPAGVASPANATAIF